MNNFTSCSYLSVCLSV